MEVLAGDTVSVPCQGRHDHSVLKLEIPHLQGTQQVLELPIHGYRVLGESVRFAADRLDDAISSVMSQHKYKYLKTSPSLGMSYNLHPRSLNSFSNLSTVDGAALSAPNNFSNTNLRLVVGGRKVAPLAHA